jgi:hypothetical protein
MTSASPPITIDDSETATAVEAAAMLVALAIHDTTQPVERLCEAMERMCKALAAGTAASTVANSASGARDAQLGRDLAVCVEGLQFHDRLLQQLAFVRDLLGAILQHQPLDVAAYGAPRWEALMAVIRRRAPLDRRFELFDLLAAAEVGKVAGGCELFE